MTYSALFRRILLLVSIVEVHTGASSSLRIIGGREALKDEYPYVAKVEVVLVNTNTSSHAQSITICTASVLSLTWSLTAAHCIKFLDRFSLQHPGLEHRLMIRTQPDDGLFQIFSMHKHPSFKGIILDPFMLIENDIGMLKTEPITMKRYARLSAVDFSTVKGQAANVVGYGLSVVITEKQGKNHHQLPRPLKVIDLVVVKCSQRWHLYPAMCVARRCGRSPTMCAGDSGGPLIHPSGIIAITSVNMAKDCRVEAKDRSHTVGVLTAISPYVTWITSHIKHGE